MFNKKLPVEKTGLEKAIDDLFVEMASLTGDDPAYAIMADQVEKLYKLKEVDQKVASSRRVSPDTWATVIANVTGILMIVGHERANVVTSRALTLLQKLK